MRIIVWILEDDETLGYMLKTVLPLAHPAIDLRLFETGEAALKAAGSPDILFADTYLAGRLTGPEVVEVLRRRNPDLAVMFSSSMGVPPGVSLEPRDRALPKPFSVAAMLKEVSGMICQIPRLQVPPGGPHPTARRFRHQ